MGSKSDVSAFFRLRFRNGLGTKPAGVLPFRMRVPNTFFLEFGLVACRLPSLTLRKGLPCLRQPFVFVFSRFQKQRFGSFLAAVSHGLGTILLSFYVGSKSDVSAFFWLRFRNGLGTKPAGVLLFRMRVPNTFFLSLAWWLAGFFFVFSRFQKQRFGSFLAAVSHGLGAILLSFLVGSKSDVSAFFRLRFRNGLGTKPAGVCLFACAFFLSLVWWLAGFQVLTLRKGLPCLRQPFSLFLVGSKSNVSAVFWLRFRMVLGTPRVRLIEKIQHSCWFVMAMLK